MFDTQTTALLRAILDEVCRDVSLHATGTRRHVAVKILEAARQGETMVDGLTRVGRDALGEASVSWR